MRREWGKEKSREWVVCWFCLKTHHRLHCRINKEQTLFFYKSGLQQNVLPWPHGALVLRLLNWFFFFHLCSGAFTSLCQHINGLCDVSCQGSSLITRGRLSEAVNPSGLALYLTKSRERHTHTHAQRDIQGVKTTACHTFAVQTPNWDSHFTHMLNI